MCLVEHMHAITLHSTRILMEKSNCMLKRGSYCDNLKQIRKLYSTVTGSSIREKLNNKKKEKKN